MYNNKHSGVCLMLFAIAIAFVGCTNRTTNKENQDSVTNIVDKRNVINTYIEETYTLENDTIFTNWEGENFTLNKNKYYLISILDMIIGVSGDINEIKSGEFDFNLNGNTISVHIDRDMYPTKLDTDNELYYFLFQISDINKKEDKYLEIYDIKANGAKYISENVFYEKAQNTIKQ